MSTKVNARLPIGTDADQAAGIVWPMWWADATGYARRYRIGSPAEAYHTGADLNYNPPGHWDADRLAPVFAILPGVVIHAGNYPVWKNVIVIRHFLEDNGFIYARYAHVKDLTMVQEEARVEQGQQIARIGNADGTMAFHLHFDLSPTLALDDNPADWPKLDLARLKRNYVDPRVWLQSRIVPPKFTKRIVRVTAKTLLVRGDPSTNNASVGSFKRNDLVEIANAAPTVNKYNWQRLADNLDHWIATDYTENVD